MLNNAALVVEWDEGNKKEIEEAKGYYQKARKEGRKIEDMEGKVIEFFKPNLKGFRILGKQLKPSQVAIRFINEKGDETLIWDSNDPDETKEAEERFGDYLKRGWKAYAVGMDGGKTRRIRSFSASTQEIIFAENNFRTKIKDFVAQFREIKVLPRTYPG